MRDHGSAMTNPKEQRVIVCALATAEYAVPGSVFTHRCMDCAQYVALAPSGQRHFAAYPEARFLCAPCALKRPREQTDVHEILPGAMEEFVASFTDPDTGRSTKQ